MNSKFFFFVLLFSQFFFAQNSWETLNPKPSSGNNKSIVFNSGIGYLINDSKELITTTDNGESWVVKQTVSSANDIKFSSNVGFIVGDNGYVLKSTDSGANWVQVNIGTSEMLNSVSVFADKVIISSDKNLFISTDGNNFTPKTIDILNPWVRKSVFTTSSEGHIYSSGKVYKTLDSGTTWIQTLNYSSTPNDLNLLYFKNQNEGYINFGHNEFRKTNDGGQTWTTVPGNWSYSIKSMFFANQNTGFAVGTYGNIYKTINNGLNWTNYSESFFASDGKTLQGVTFINENKGFAVGNNGIILKTNDSGANWVKNSFTYDNVNEIQKVDDFYYVQGGDHLYKSLDMKSWQELTSPIVKDLYPYIMDFQMVTSSVSYAFVGTAGSSNLAKSIDGGQSWAIIPNTYGGDYNLQFINENVGFRSGSNLYKTTDGGITWNKIITPYASSVRFLTENVGFALTSSQLFKTNDGGMNWNIISDISDYVSNYQFLNEQDGFILSNYGILKTKDGGVTWEKITTAKSYQYINFQNANIGYLSGQYSDDHAYTDNGGVTWKSISKPFPDISRFVINKQLYLGGTYGKMATTNLVFDKIYLKNNRVSEVTAQKANIVGYGSSNTGNLENIVFEYSTDNSFTNIIAVNSNPAIILEAKNASLEAVLDQLNPTTTYFVRIKALNNGISYFSNSIEFKTKEAFTEALTFTKIKSRSILLNTSISSNDDKGIQNLKIIYGTDANNLGSVLEISPNIVAPNSTVNIATTVNGLSPNTTYYFKVKFTYNGVENLGKLYTIKTIEGPALSLSSYEPYFPKFSGYIQTDEKISNIVFQYGSQSFENVVASNPSVMEEGTHGYVSSVSEVILNQNQTYYIRIKGDYENTALYSNTEVYNPYSPIVLARNNENLITETSVKINGFIKTNGFTATNLKVIYGLSPQSLNNSINLEPNSVTNYETTKITGEITEVDFNTTYYYQFVTQSNTGKLTNYASEIYTFKLSDLQLKTGENILNKLLIYPNPISDYFKIEIKEQIKSVEILDVQGKLVKIFSSDRSTSNNIYNVENLNTGVYIVKIKLVSGEIITKKIIKK
ncbi:YCF48-related protein [Kaistella sp.]|uniref:YCF48-related protein n=1 Tax=Kaistella sp. TaxID=2782235 RepID=UPI003C3D5364